jgi:hypothetical protein
VMLLLNEDSLIDGTIYKAVGRASKASISVVLPVGQKGRIPVYMCHECSRIFQDQPRNSPNDGKQTLLTNRVLIVEARLNR